MTVNPDPIQLESRLQYARRYGDLHYTVIQRCEPIGSAIEAADFAAQASGLTPLGANWQAVDRHNALALLRYALTRDLAYNCQRMPDALASEFLDEILAPAEPATSFFTNWSVTDWQYVVEQKRIHSTGSWCPVSGATFDLAVVAVGPRATVMLCVEDED